MSWTLPDDFLTNSVPDPKVESAVELRKLYKPGGQREFDRQSPAGLAKSVSKCHDVNQGIIRGVDRMREEFNLKLRNAVVVAVLGWVPAIAVFAYQFLR